jgi:hypothetical protein
MSTTAGNMNHDETQIPIPESDWLEMAAMVGGLSPPPPTTVASAPPPPLATPAEPPPPDPPILTADEILRRHAASIGVTIEALMDSIEANAAKPAEQGTPLKVVVRTRTRTERAPRGSAQARNDILLAAVQALGVEVTQLRTLLQTVVAALSEPRCVPDDAAERIMLANGRA